MGMKMHLTLKKKMIAIFSLLIVMPTIIIYLYQNMVVLEYLHEKITQTAIETINYHNSLVEKKLQSLSDLSFNIAQQNQVQELLRGDDFSYGSIYLMHKDLSSTVYFLEDTFDTEILSLTLIKNDSVIYQYKNDIFNSNETVKAMDWYTQTLANKGNTYWIGVNEHTKPLISGQGSQTVKTLDLSRSVYDKYTRSFIGTIYLSVVFDSVFYSDYFEDRMIFFQNISDIKNFYGYNISDEITPQVLSALKDGSIAGQSGSFNMDINGHKYLLFYTEPNKYGWRMIELASQQKVMSKINSVRSVGIIIAIVTFIMFLFFMYMLFYSLINPIQKMFNYINHGTNRHKTNDINTHINLIEDMNSSIISLVETNKQIKDDFANVNYENNKNKYKKLQMQINPHFLYNTLNSIKILAETNRVHLVSVVTTNLVKILSACMDKNGLYIRVADEIDTLQRYTEIQQIVYGDSIVFIYEIDSNLSGYEVPNFILQPIVENSIAHGIDRTKAQHIIKIKNYLSQGSLFFEISDTGLGISKYMLEQIYQDLSNDEKTMHIGIKSVHQRVQMSYGKGYGISIESTVGVGSIFTIKLPAIEFNIGAVQ